MKISDLLARFSSKPLTVAQAESTLQESKATLDSVAALFAAADLNLEQMLTAGPDSLKAHLDSLADADGQLAQALDDAIAKNAELETQLSDITKTSSTAQSFLATYQGALGIESGTTTSAEEIQSAIDSTINTRAQELLATSGLPNALAHVQETVTEADSAILEKYEAMAAGPERLAYFNANKATLARALAARE